MMKKGERTINPVYDFSSNKVRRMIKFGTNCDLSDEKKWAQHQKELQKLPAWYVCTMQALLTIVFRAVSQLL